MSHATSKVFAELRRLVGEGRIAFSRFLVRSVCSFSRFVFLEDGGAVGPYANHIGDIVGCGESEVIAKIRVFSDYRFESRGCTRSPPPHVGMVLPRGDDFSVQTTQEDFRKNVRRLPTSPELRAARQQPLSPEAVKLRQCKFGELFGVAAFSRLDICDRLARIASLANSSQGSDVYRASNLVTTVPARRQAAILKCASSPYPGPPARGEADGRIRSRAGEVHCGAMTLVCWSVAIFADQLPEGKCQLGYVMGLMFSTLNGPCHFLQWASKLTRKLAKSC